MQGFICDGVRTPIGRYGGALSGVRTDDLGAVPLKALMHRTGAWFARCTLCIGVGQGIALALERV